MLDAQTASQLGMQSSQPQGNWGDPKKGDSNENLAYYLAMMASNPGAQNASAVQSGQAETLGGLGLPGLTGTQAQGATWEQILSGMKTGMSTLSTGKQVWDVGSKLYNALYGGSGVSDTPANLSWLSGGGGEAPTDVYDWWTWGW